MQRIDTILEAETIDEIFAISSFGAHPLTGTREGEIAIVLHGRWRLHIVQMDEGTVQVKEVTNHYGD